MPNQANVFWLTGLSGAGKTTVGDLLYQHLKKSLPNVVLLDGDMLRTVFGDDLGYSRADRMKSAMRNARLCALLQSQNIHVVCCTISMFHSVRSWNRKNIPNYKEIYLKVSPQTLYARDQKSLYSGFRKGQQSDIAGMDVSIEEPENPDLLLCNEGGNSPEASLQKIIETFGL